MLTARVRIARLVVSWLLVGVGVPLLLRAELGVSPFDVLNTGVSHVTGWSLGTSFIVDSILLFVTGRLLGGRLGPACVPGTVVIGLMVNVGLDAIAVQHALVPRIAMLGLVHRGMGIVPARWISDGLPVVLGAALGGSIGVGTVLFVVTMGPMVKAGLRVLRYQPSTRTTLDLPIVGP